MIFTESLRRETPLKKLKKQADFMNIDFEIQLDFMNSYLQNLLLF